MSLIKKRAPLKPPQEMERVIQQVYDDLNDIINAVNSISLAGRGDRGKPGDIRIVTNQDQGSINYYLEFKSNDGWVRLTGELISET